MCGIYVCVNRRVTFVLYCLNPWLTQAYTSMFVNMCVTCVCNSLSVNICVKLRVTYGVLYVFNSMDDLDLCVNLCVVNART